MAGMWPLTIARMCFSVSVTCISSIDPPQLRSCDSVFLTWMLGMQDCQWVGAAAGPGLSWEYCLLLDGLPAPPFLPSYGNCNIPAFLPIYGNCNIPAFLPSYGNCNIPAFLPSYGSCNIPAFLPNYGNSNIPASLPSYGNCNIPAFLPSYGNCNIPNSLPW